MATTVGTERMTAADFSHHPAANGPSELAHGEIRVLAPAGGRHAGIAANVFRAPDRHVEPRALGRCFMDGTGFALPPDADTVRSPAGGTELAWVIDPRRRAVEVHAAGQPVRCVPWGAELDGAPVLPEFRVAVADLFRGAVSPS